MESELLTVREAAEYLSCNPETIRRAIRDGRLEAYKLGRDHRISRLSLDNFLKRKGFRNIQLREVIYDRFAARAESRNQDPLVLMEHIMERYLEGDLDSQLERAVLKRTPVIKK